MKYVQSVGLAALAVLSTAAIATSSASAATICSTAGTGTACKSGHGNQYTGSILGSNEGNNIFSVKNEGGEVINTLTATSSTIGGTITNSGEGTGDITKLTFSGVNSSICTDTPVVTTTASTTSPWPFTVSTDGATENTNGIMTISNIGMQFTCTFLTMPSTCKYTAATAQLTIDGSDTAPRLTATNVVLTGAPNQPSFVCGSSLAWNGTYKVTTPSSLFVE